MDVVVNDGHRSITVVVDQPTTSHSSIILRFPGATFTHSFGVPGAPTTLSIESEAWGNATQIDLLSQADALGFPGSIDEAAFLANADTGVVDILQEVLLDAQPSVGFWNGMETLVREMSEDGVEPVSSGCFGPCMSCIGAILIYIASLLGIGAGCGPSPVVAIACAGAFLVHAQASINMVTKCLECAECRERLDDGGREDDDDSNGSAAGSAQG